MKEELLLLKNQLKMGHRISFAEAMLLQRAIDILVNKAGNSPAQSDCCPAQNHVSPEQNSVAPAQSGNSPAIPDGYVLVPKEATKEILDEFDSIIDYGAEDSVDAWHRLLAAAPQSPGIEPATVPGKWIPVSERMPEVGVKVLCFPAEDEPIHAVFNGQLWLQDISWSNSDEPIDNVITCNVTHWVPLPASPQEVK